MPAKELSILRRAIAKQNAGNKFPKMPVTTRRPAFLSDTPAIWKIANGTKTMAAEKIRREAICEGVSAWLLTFIKIKELPQIKQSSTKMDQLINLLLIKEERRS